MRVEKLCSYTSTFLRLGYALLKLSMCSDQFKRPARPRDVFSTHLLFFQRMETTTCLRHRLCIYKYKKNLHWFLLIFPSFQQTHHKDSLISESLGDKQDFFFILFYSILFQPRTSNVMSFRGLYIRPASTSTRRREPTTIPESESESRQRSPSSFPDRLHLRVLRRFFTESDSRLPLPRSFSIRVRALSTERDRPAYHEDSEPLPPYNANANANGTLPTYDFVIEEETRRIQSLRRKTLDYHATATCWRTPVRPSLPERRDWSVLEL